MYFLFSVVPSRKKWPHVQQTMPTSQYAKHALHCALGSTSSSSYSSVFPAALITSRDSLLKGLNGRCCWRSFWSTCRWGWFSIFWIKIWTLTPCDRFTVKFGTLGMLKSMFSSSIARLNSLSALNDAMSRFSSGTNCSFTMRVLALDFTSSLFHREHAWRECLQTVSQVSLFHLKSQVLCKRLSSISFERCVFPLSTKTRSVFPSFPDQSQIGLGFGLGWFGEFNTWCFSKRLLNEFHNSLLFNCRTQLIIPSGPIVIVSQLDLWWWSRRQGWFFTQNFPSFSTSQLLECNKLEVFLEG